MNLALAPTTLTTGWSPMVLVTTPAHPASNARRMLLSDSVGGAEERRKGFSKCIPVKLTDRFTDMSISSKVTRGGARDRLAMEVSIQAHAHAPADPSLCSR